MNPRVQIIRKLTEAPSFARHLSDDEADSGVDVDVGVGGVAASAEHRRRRRTCQCCKRGCVIHSHWALRPRRRIRGSTGKIRRK